jgi:hypothetical protein
MNRLLERCAALDVHKKQLAACVRILGTAGEIEDLNTEFSTMTSQLDDDLAAVGAARLAEGAGGHARRDGGHGRVSEAGLLRAGG